MVELASRLIEAQKDTCIEILSLEGLSSKSVHEPTEGDKLLINALLDSGFSHI